ncbi:AhpC/TSA family protein [Prevotella sp. A2931]|uniref:AhpC/TSA family protein n=1 Tax=Prevotella illustrans TaxID=2800387 RepID=A0ABS3M7L4_9BACT|nr:MULTISPECIES: TlpA disulfide reductase family protein [Prevotella]MBO1364143.1 AhpC/TSA family protein [Prevotella illustrans]PTL26936.1 thioredoxin [Prevotella sp. oral taxon 820]
MTKQLLFIAAIFLIIVCKGSAQSVVCHISGKVEDLKEKRLILYESGTDPRVNNYITIDIKDGRFDYDLSIDTLKCYTVTLSSEYEKGSMRVADFIAENTTVYITIPAGTGDSNDLIKTESDGKENAMMMRYAAYKDSVFTIYGPQFQKLEARRDSLHKDKLYLKPIVYEIYSKMEHARNTQRDSLRLLLPENPLSNLGAEMEAKYKELTDDFYVDLTKWFENNKCFYSLAEIRKGVAMNTLPKKQARLEEIFLKQYVDYMPKHPYTQEAAYGIAASRLQVGKPYIDYHVRGTDGQTVKLSSLYKGKIIFIDMWASWCGPCRRHAKSVIPVYEKYKDKGFQVIGIARERNIKTMEAAIKQDGYPWLNLLELNDHHNIWLKNGLNNSGGGGFLIDEKGIILAIYPEADELEQILQERL